MTRYLSHLHLLAFFVVLLAGCDGTTDMNVDPGDGSRPNILLIIADDLGVDATPGYSTGTTKPSMPNLQELAANGITFDNVWARPVCSPTRASMLTGKHGFRTGVLNAEDASTIPATEKTIQSFLDENTSKTYSHSLIGKWHLSSRDPSRPTDMGIDYYAGLLGGSSDYDTWSLTENGVTSDFSGYITTKITDLAIDWISAQEKPWYCWLAYTAPHTPFHLPPENMHSQGNLPSDQASIDANPTPYYMAMVESIDYELGRLIGQIPANERENTIIIFIGDNGTPAQVIQAPYQSSQAKGSLYQGGVHVPMIISGATVTRANERDDHLINTTDLFSTIAEIAGIVLDTYEDSFSFQALFSNPTASLREYNYSEVLSSNANKSGYTIRNERYKLMQLDNSNQRLFDLLSDPYEQQNLLSGTLSAAETAALTELTTKAAELRGSS